MSLVGNFTLNGDREAAHNGVSPPDAVRRPSNAHQAENAHDSDASTIAANPDDARSRRSTNNNERPDQKTAAPSQAYEDGDEASSMARREEEVHQLARRFTEQSHFSATGHNPFSAEPGSTLR